ncbi:DDE-type integrase/transposase/recombinase [Allomuricauda taeanensis]|uniref:DDE-type integrase/transposase/recombinase n=1 Tax=Flagellimonas taeanensis TaxID=1005926 RepID=UPI002E7AC66D|nr:DDE-type integrase/transposase/recombinase [Allomuricauda taeanensis]MEE1963584.1 DDE-type integrase/transposase/recombinase [Allomuricauda taeanensis]
MQQGYLYLVAIIDLHSRYVLNWSVSNSMDAQWCRETLEEAIGGHGTSEILNTDQGSQFTAEEFANYVLGQGIRLSMDGKGKATDNAFIERLWRNVKYEKIYRTVWTFICYWQSTLIITTMKEDISPSTMKDLSIYLRERLDNYISFVENPP